jgi:dienelactone hydrolase
LTGIGQAARTATTAANGVYIFAGVTPGSYTLVVTAPIGFTLGATNTMPIAVASGAQASASTFVLTRNPVSTCTLARPDFGGPASAKERELFAYDVNAPLNLQKTVEVTNASFQFSGITYSSPAGGVVTGIMVEPTGRSGPLPGIVLMHPSGQNARGMGPYAQLLASRGAVVIVIDAPYFRRGGTSVPLFTIQDRNESIQLIKDLQRAVDVLLAQSNVDPARIGFEGYSYGAIIGAHFVGIERRLKAAVLAAAHGGHVTGATNANNLSFMSTLSCATRNAWFEAMVPIEGIRYTPNSSPTELLFQIARFDNAVLLADAEALYNVAANPKEVMYYDTGHGFNAQALYDRQFWLHKKLGLDAPPSP